MSEANLCSNVEISNACRNFYVSRLRAAERLKGRVGTGAAGRGTTRGAAATCRPPLQALDALRIDLAALIDADLDLVRQLLLINEQLDEVRRDHALAALQSSPLPPITGSVTADADGSDMETPFTPFSPYTAPPPGFGGGRGAGGLFGGVQLRAGNNLETPSPAQTGALSNYPAQSMLSLLRASCLDRLPSEDFLRDVDRANYDDEVFQAFGGCGGGTSIKIVLERANVREGQDAANLGQGQESLEKANGNAVDAGEDRITVGSGLDLGRSRNAGKTSADVNLGLGFVNLGSKRGNEEEKSEVAGTRRENSQAKTISNSYALPVGFRTNKNDNRPTNPADMDVEDGISVAVATASNDAQTGGKPVYATIKLDTGTADSSSLGGRAKTSKSFFSATFQTTPADLSDETVARCSENVAMADSPLSSSSSVDSPDDGSSALEAKSDKSLYSRDAETRLSKKLSDPAVCVDDGKKKPMSTTQTKIAEVLPKPVAPKPLPKQSIKMAPPAKDDFASTTWPRKKYPAISQPEAPTASSVQHTTGRANLSMTGQMPSEEQNAIKKATASAMPGGQDTLKTQKTQSKTEDGDKHNIEGKLTAMKREQHHETQQQRSVASQQEKPETAKVKPVVAPKSVRLARSSTFTASKSEVGQARDVVRSLLPIKEQATGSTTTAGDQLNGADSGESSTIVHRQKTIAVTPPRPKSTMVQRTKSAAEQRSPERQTWAERRMLMGLQRAATPANASGQFTSVISVDEPRISADLREKTTMKRGTPTKPEISTAGAVQEYSSQTERKWQPDSAAAGFGDTAAMQKDFSATEVGGKPVRRVLSLRTTTAKATGSKEGMGEMNKADSLDGRPQTPAKVLASSKGSSFDDAEKFITIHF